MIDDDVVYVGDKVSREVEDVSLPDGSQGTTQAVPFPTPPPVGEGWTALTSPKVIILIKFSPTLPNLVVKSIIC